MEERIRKLTEENNKLKQQNLVLKDVLAEKDIEIHYLKKSNEDKMFHLLDELNEANIEIAKLKRK